MRKLLVIGGIVAWVALAWAASTGRRISDVLHVSVFHPSDLLAAARTNSTPETNVFATWYDLSNSIAANVLTAANTNTFDASNFLFGVLGTNTTVAAGAGATVGTNIVGNQRIYTVGANSTVYASNTVWVSKNGDDGTGARGDFTHPFLTPLAAANAGQPGDTVFVLPGTYGVKSVLFTFTSTLLRPNLNWHFFSGAKLTNDTASPYAIWDDNQNDYPDGIGSVYITGDGEFVDDYAGSVVRIVLPGTRLDMQFRKMSQHVSVNGGTLLLHHGLIEGDRSSQNSCLTAGNTSSTSILDHVYLHYTNNDASGRAIYIPDGNTNTILRDCVLDAGPTATKSVVAQTTGVITVYGLVSMNVTNDPNVTFLSGLYQPPLGSTVDTNIVGNTNISGILASNNVRVAAGTGVTVVTSATGGLSIYTVASTATIDNLFTNDAGVVHLRTNLPITIGTNSGPPAPLYIFSGITNDSMSGVEMDFAPLAGAGANRSGLYVWMSSGDAIGGYAPAIYGLSEGTTSNGFGAYCGSVPFGMLGKVSSAGSGDSVATIGNNLGSHLGVRYGVSGVAGGPINGNTNVGVFGSGGTNANVAVGVYAELANSISTATDAKYPRSAALILNNRQTAKPLLLGYTNSTYEVFSLLANGHAQLNSNDLYSVVAGTGIVLTTNGTALTISGTDTNTAGNTNISGILASNNVRVAAGTATSVSTGSSGGLMIYTVGSLLDTNVIGTNTAGILASNNVRVAAGANVTVTTNSSGGVSIYTVASTASGVTEIQTNGVRVGLVTNINFTAGVTGSVSASTAILGVSGSGSASLTGTTNFLQLSVQAGKPPTTNYVGIDAGWQDLEMLYYKTNAEGSIASLSASWQFIVPQDYATNTMKVRIYSTLATTNGPSTSNTIFRASVIRATPSDSTDLHTASFGSTVNGTNAWTQSTSNTNKVQSVVIAMSTTSALAAGDLCILKLDRDAVNDTFGGVTSVVGLQLEYTRP